MDNREHEFRSPANGDRAFHSRLAPGRAGRDIDLSRPLRVGYGVSLAHHGELFQGQIEDRDGQRHRCLLSLPCNRLYSRVVFRPEPSGPLSVQPAHKQKTLRTLTLVLDYLRVPFLGGTATVESNIAEAKGYGSSTADCVAAARAAADAVGRAIPDEDVGRLVVRAEIASDNVMFDRAVLFAQREGAVLEDYLRRVPELEVIGVDTEPHGFVDTLVYPPAAYAWQEVRIFQALVGALRRAVRTNDRGLLGRVATASAVVNERFLPKPLFGELQARAQEVRALGVAVAHSGTVAGVLFDPDDPAIEHKVERTLRALDAMGLRDALRFQTGLPQGVSA